MQPGQVISPKSSNDTPPQAPVGAPEPDRPEETGGTMPTPPEGGDTAARMQGAPTSQEASFYVPELAATPPSDWQYAPQASSLPASEASAPREVAWTATEFISHPKGVEWYLSLIGVSFLLTAVVFVLTSDVFSAGVVVFMAILFGVYAARKPRMQQYGLDRSGVHVGPKTYSFQDFKTFSITEESSIASVVLMPLKRFMPPLTIYVSNEAEETVLSVLSQYLPFEQHKTDAIDSLLRRIRF